MSGAGRGRTGRERVGYSNQLTLPPSPLPLVGLVYGKEGEKKRDGYSD